MFSCHFKTLSLPKRGDTQDKNEDNFLIPSDAEDILLKFAVSDGATESSFSKVWSDLLVCSFKDKSFDKEHLAETLKGISDTWQSMATAIELPWYAQEKTETGAFATFLGLTINREDKTFETVAIGDCNLFQIRNDELLFTFPVTTIEEFGNTPNLIASNQKYQTEFEKTVAYSNGSILPNDLIILATDALAAWIFKKKDAGEKPWKHLANILNFENYKMDFENWLNNQRESKEIKNDDVTLLILKFE
jgi:hypothetical protein